VREPHVDRTGRKLDTAAVRVEVGEAHLDARTDANLRISVELNLGVRAVSRRDVIAAEDRRVLHRGEGIVRVAALNGDFAVEKADARDADTVGRGGIGIGIILSRAGQRRDKGQRNGERTENRSSAPKK
jgi:hypothetical protein